MNKKLNLVELLKGKEGIELWSPIFGKCTLDSLNSTEDELYPIEVLWINNEGKTDELSFTEEGCFFEATKAYCMLFPSEEAYLNNRGWEDFKPKKLIIANAADYKPMYHWIRGNKDANKAKLIEKLVGVDGFDCNLHDWGWCSNPLNGNKGFFRVESLDKGIMTEFIPVFAEVEEWIPEDLELVYVIDDKHPMLRAIGLYDAESKGVWMGTKDIEKGFQRLMPCSDPDLQEWAEKIRTKLRIG